MKKADQYRQKSAANIKFRTDTFKKIYESIHKLIEDYTETEHGEKFNITIALLDKNTTKDLDNGTMNGSEIYDEFNNDLRSKNYNLGTGKLCYFGVEVSDKRIETNEELERLSDKLIIGDGFISIEINTAYRTIQSICTGYFCKDPCGYIYTISWK